jgi:hypothetical protein
MTEVTHPLDPATAGEYLAGREIMAAAGLLSEPVTVPRSGGCAPSCSTPRPASPPTSWSR